MLYFNSISPLPAIWLETLILLFQRTDSLSVATWYLLFVIMLGMNVWIYLMKSVSFNYRAHFLLFYLDLLRVISLLYLPTLLTKLHPSWRHSQCLNLAWRIVTQNPTTYYLPTSQTGFIVKVFTFVVVFVVVTFYCRLWFFFFWRFYFGIDFITVGIIINKLKKNIKDLGFC